MSSKTTNTATPVARGEPNPGIVRSYKARLQTLGCKKPLPFRELGAGTGLLPA